MILMRGRKETMTSVKKTKRMLCASLLSLVACCAMLLGGTYAWFTDTVGNTDNRIVVGSLEIELYQVDSDGENTIETEVLNDTNFFEGITWEPGDVHYQNLTIKNAGNLALKYELTLNWSGFNTIGSDGKSLKDVLKVAVVNGHIEDVEDRKTVLNKVNGAWNGLDTKLTGEMAGKTLVEGVETMDTENFAIVVYWEPTDSDSDYNVSTMGKTSDEKPLYVGMRLTLVATQQSMYGLLGTGTVAAGN